MKKLTLVLAALLLVSAGAFAVDVVPTAAIEGNASVTFGIDLNDTSTGLANANEAKLTITLVPEDTTESKGEGAPTGFITLKFDAMGNSDDGNFTLRASVDAAKLNLTDMISLNILGLDKTVNKASTGMGINPGLKIESAVVADVSEAVAEEHKGLGIGFDFGAATLDLGVSSAYDWIAADKNTDNDYSFYAGVALTAVENLTAEVAFNFELENNTWGLGIKAGYDLGIVPILVGFDFNSSNAWQLGAGLALKLGDGEKEAFGADDPKFKEGLTVGFGMDSADPMGIDLTASFFDGALIPVVDLLVVFEMANLENLGLGVRADFDLGDIDPYAEFKHTAAANALEVGVSMAVIDLTTFTLKYVSTDLGDDSGVITFETKVSF
ncbi:hypothetical protein [Spirochaeta lutea]|uniref:Porin domain-containing protein n=1 Tax=Spirochaeta lutea TaxID=1480694 RepID=A0A098QW51_9SPIO|nr:hypothetical protein [Spirochaeta lutea]KGE71633.1 hypothetical protein DC28_10200 [Spirochaeta lutea]